LPARARPARPGAWSAAAPRPRAGGSRRRARRRRSQRAPRVGRRSARSRLALRGRLRHHEPVRRGRPACAPPEARQRRTRATRPGSRRTSESRAGSGSST
jgi:hypothetical protein